MLCGFGEVGEVNSINCVPLSDGIAKFLRAHKTCIGFSCGEDGKNGKAVHFVEAGDKLVEKCFSSCIGVGLEDHMDLSVLHFKHRIDGVFNFSRMVSVIIDDHDVVSRIKMLESFVYTEISFKSLSDRFQADSR